VALRERVSDQELAHLVRGLAAEQQVLVFLEGARLVQELAAE
jgi:hypothetical protein